MVSDRKFVEGFQNRTHRICSFNLILLIGGYLTLTRGASISSNVLGRPCDKWGTCSQNCENGTNHDTFVCSCLEDFYLANDNRSCSPNDPAIRVVYALRSSIRIVDITTKKPMIIVENKGQRVGVTVDVKGGYIFWTDITVGRESVYRSKVNGEGPIETIVDTGLLVPEGIAFDWVTGNIYIADSNRSHIVVCKGDGQVCTVLTITRQLTMDKPREIALHPLKGLMFWTDWGEMSSIMRANMDGSFTIPIVTKNIKWPNSLTVDHGNDRIYWIDAFYDKIETSKFTGEDRQLVNSDKVHHPFSLEIFADLIFWSDWHLKEIQSCSKFDCKSDIRTVVKTTTPPNGIAIFHPAAQPEMKTNPCEEKCSHICLLSANSGYSCKCPAGYKLDDTLRNCIDDETKAKILIGHDNKIKILRFETIGRYVDILEEMEITELNNIGALVYNPINDTVFISDLTLKSIFEYSFTSRKLSTVVDNHLDTVKSMSLDPIGENLYWVDSNRRKIEVMSLRTKAKALLSMEEDKPQSIIAVPEERYLFLALTGTRGGQILRMNMNGHNRRTLVRTTLGEPISLTYNAELRQVFWVDFVKDSIEHTSISGMSQQITAKKFGVPFGLTSFKNRIFWSDRHTQLLHSLIVSGMDQKESPIFIGDSISRLQDRNNSNGTSESSSFNENFLAKLTIMYKNSTKYENLTRYHECSATRRKPKCSHICLISGDFYTGTCICPEGMQRNNDGLSCSWSSTCLKTQFQCIDKHCIDANFRCDGDHDCTEGEDELDCQQLNLCSSETSFVCESDKSCIHTRWRCDGDRDCPNGEDEFNCSIYFPNSCAAMDFRCSDGKCIPQSWKCDNELDCVSGEDEQNCNGTCPIGEFQCKNDLKCISLDLLCDGYSDCRDGTDEHEDCDLPFSTTTVTPTPETLITTTSVLTTIDEVSLDNTDEPDMKIEQEILKPTTVSVEANNTLERQVVQETTPIIETVQANNTTSDGDISKSILICSTIGGIGSEIPRNSTVSTVPRNQFLDYLDSILRDLPREKRRKVEHYLLAMANAFVEREKLSSVEVELGQ